MSQCIDLIKVVDGNNQSWCFSERLFDLILHADRDNKNKLRGVFPNEVTMVETYQSTGEIIDPREPNIIYRQNNFRWVKEKRDDNS